MSREGHNRLADHTLLHQFDGAMHFRVSPSIVGYAQSSALLRRDLHHELCFCQAHGHRLFAQHVGAGAQRFQGLGRVEEDRSGHVDGIKSSMAQCLLYTGECSSSKRLSFGSVARHYPSEPATRLVAKCGYYALDGNIPKSDNQPSQHAFDLNAF